MTDGSNSDPIDDAGGFLTTLISMARDPRLSFGVGIIVGICLMLIVRSWPDIITYLLGS